MRTPDRWRPCPAPLAWNRVSAVDNKDEFCTWREWNRSVRGVFRYLDTSHDGDISRREFETLERVWRELQQSMYEHLDSQSNKGMRLASCDSAWVC